MDAAAQRAVVDRTQDLIAEINPPDRLPLRGERVGYAALLLGLSASAAGAAPWWTLVAGVALMLGWVSVLAGRMIDATDVAGVAGLERRRRPDGTVPSIKLRAPLSIGSSAIGGAVFDAWWFGLAAIAALWVESAVRRRVRSRRLIGGWPARDPAKRPSAVIGESPALELTAALAMLDFARPSLIAEWVGLDPDAVDRAVETLRQFRHLEVARFDGTETQYQLSRHGRKTFREHIRAIAPDRAT